MGLDLSPLMLRYLWDGPLGLPKNFFCICGSGAWWRDQGLKHPYNSGLGKMEPAS